jgi:protein-tyrosine phosphatase
LIPKNIQQVIPKLSSIQSVPSHPYASIFQHVQLHEKIMLPPHRIELILAKIDQMRKVPISTVLRMAEEILPSDVVTILRAMNPDEVKQMYDSTSTEELADLLLKICSPSQLSTLLTLDVSSLINVEAFDSFDNNLSYITDKIAVGNHLSNYQPFDVVVNLNYPQNGVNRYEIHRSTDGAKKIYKIGLLDGPDEPMGDILKQLIPELLAIEPEPKILFHCYAGISRSSTCAAAYYAKKNKVSAEEALKVLVEKRSIIRPNSGFLQALQTYVA